MQNFPDYKLGANLIEKPIFARLFNVIPRTVSCKKHNII